MKMSEILFHRYEYLARKYANKIFSYSELSFEYDDLLQEFRIKIFTSIKAYGRRWSKYRRNEASRPVPIRYYLECACSNKATDFMKGITREGYKTRIDQISYDFGVEDDVKIAPEMNCFILHGVDLLEGLSGRERALFSLFLRGYNDRILNKVYFNKQDKKTRQQVLNSGDEPFKVSDIIDEHRNFLIKKYGSELLRQQPMFSTFHLDED